MNVKVELKMGVDNNEAVAVGLTVGIVVKNVMGIRMEMGMKAEVERLIEETVEK